MVVNLLLLRLLLRFLLPSHLLISRSPDTEYLPVGILICIGIIVMLMPWPIWIASLAGLGLVVVGNDRESKKTRTQFVESKKFPEKGDEAKNFRLELKVE